MAAGRTPPTSSPPRGQRITPVGYDPWRCWGPACRRSPGKRPGSSTGAPWWSRARPTRRWRGSSARPTTAWRRCCSWPRLRRVGRTGADAGADAGATAGPAAPSLFGATQFANAGSGGGAALTFNHGLSDEDRGRASPRRCGRTHAASHGGTWRTWRRRVARILWTAATTPHAGRALAEAASRLIDRDPRPLALVTGMFRPQGCRRLLPRLRRDATAVDHHDLDSPIAAGTDELVEARPARRAGAGDVVTSPTASPAPWRPTARRAVLICGGLTSPARSWHEP